MSLCDILYFVPVLPALSSLPKLPGHVLGRCQKKSGQGQRRPLRGRGYKPRASQPQVHEDDEAQDSGLDDGIVEEAAPETILPMDD